MGWWVDGWDETSKWYFESRTSLQLCGNFALATTSLLAATGARLGWRCLAAVATPDYMHRAAKWLLTTNKNLPKFTPIFLILPQTLVVCQNWLASNLEKDILRKCQKCRRMEDNVGCSARLLEQCISKSLTNLHHNNIHVPRLLMHRISIKRLGNIFSKAQEWMVIALLPKLPQPPPSLPAPWFFGVETKAGMAAAMTRWWGIIA